MLTPVFKAGDILGFSGRHWWSAAIALGTGGIPFWSLSHVGILAHAPDGRLLLFESTDSSDPCEITGKPIHGVQAHWPEDVIADYRGRVWHYSLYRPLYEHEENRLTRFLQTLIGRPYDEIGAVRAGGFLLSIIEGILRQEDLSHLFCSEVDAAALSHLGIWATANASRWSPRRLIKKLRRAGIMRKPVRLK